MVIPGRAEASETRRGLAPGAQSSWGEERAMAVEWEMVLVLSDGLQMAEAGETSVGQRASESSVSVS